MFKMEHLNTWIILIAQQCYENNKMVIDFLHLSVNEHFLLKKELMGGGN